MNGHNHDTNLEDTDLEGKTDEEEDEFIQQFIRRLEATALEDQAYAPLAESPYFSALYPDEIPRPPPDREVFVITTTKQAADIDHSFQLL